MLPRYTVRLRSDATAEALRPYVVQAATAASAATGVELVIASGTTTATEPNTAEILVDVTDQSPCGPLGSVGTVGCGGPTWWSDGLPGGDLITVGNVWITPAWQSFSEADRRGLVAHELGHVLGLDHTVEVFQGSQQLMYPSLNGVTTYLAGDQAGLRSVWAGRPNAAYPYPSWEAYVDAQIWDFTGVESTTAKQREVAAKLRAGTLSTTTYVTQLMGDPWFRPAIAPVVRLYWAYFGRKPDNDGVRYWVDRRRMGVTLSKVSQTFATSSEFTRRYGSLTNRQFVTRIYTDVLGRTADSGGVDYWTRKLDGGTSRGQVMVNFSESSEYVRTMAPKVDAVLVYIGLVRAVPGAADLAAAEQMPLPVLIRHVQFSPDHGGRPRSYCAKYCAAELWPRPIDWDDLF